MKVKTIGLAHYQKQLKSFTVTKTHKNKKTYNFYINLSKHRTSDKMATVQNFDLPRFSRDDPEIFFGLFDNIMSNLNITEPKHIIYHVGRGIPQQIFELTLDPQFTAVPENEKYEYLKRLTIAECKKSKEEPFAAAMKLKKKPDNTYVEFLKRIKSITQACGNPKDLIESVFLQNITCEIDYKMAKSKVLANDSIETIAELLDKISKNKSTEINAITSKDRNTPGGDIREKLEKLTITCMKLNDELEKEKEKTRNFFKNFPTYNEARRNLTPNEYIDNPAKREEQRNRVDYESKNYRGQPMSGNFQQQNSHRSYANRYDQTDRYQAPRTHQKRDNFYSNTVDTVCYYHNRFGEGAIKCTPPCNFNSSKTRSKNVYVRSQEPLP